MKKLLNLLTLLALSTTVLTGCEFISFETQKDIQKIRISLNKNEYYINESFDLNSITASLTYDDYSTIYDVPYESFSKYSLTLSLISPNERTIADYAFDECGTWTVKLTNNKKTSVYGYSTVSVLQTVEQIVLDQSSATLSIGESVTINSTILPSGATNTELTWKSSDDSIATVIDGVVTAKSIGNCIITATSTNGVSASCVIVAVANETTTYNFTRKNWETTSDDWTSIKDGNGYLNNGIQVTTRTSGASAISPIEFSSVDKIVVTYCTNSSKGEGSIQIYVGDVLKGEVSATKNGGTTKREAVFNFDELLSGKIKLVINCTVSSIYISSITIHCVSDPIYASDISISGNGDIGLGEESQLVVNYNPIETNQRNVTWSSNNEDVASVSENGLVKGISEGNAIITAKVKTENDFISADFNVYVHPIAVTGITLDKYSKDVYVGASISITPTILPSNATNKNLSFSSSDTSVATVNANGVVTGISVGTINIVVTTEDGNFTASCIINVMNQPENKTTKMKYNLKDYSENNVYDISSSPSTGEPSFLVIPVWFTNSSNYISSSCKNNVISDIKTAFMGTNAETGWRSVKTYYQEMSNDLCHINVTVSNWYECGSSSSTYYSETMGQDRTNDLVEKATKWYFEQNPSDSRTNYDSDKDGYLDSVILIYASPDYTNMAAYERFDYYNMWAYVYWLQDEDLKSTTNPGPNAFMWASYDFMYSSSTAYYRAGSANGSGDTANCSIDTHTFIHESGHIFGLDDYYDYGDRGYKPAGGFSMQDCNVGSHDPFSTLALGWASPYIPTTSTTIEIGAFQTTHELILLTPSWNEDDSPFDEYLLLELYTPTGLNEFDCTYCYSSSTQGPNAIGIRLWHVDARLLYCNNLVAGSCSYKASNITTNPTFKCQYGVTFMMSNSYSPASSDDYLSPLGSDYANYNILQLIRNNTSATYKPTDNFSSSSLFKNGSSFSMSTFKNQFVNSGKLNSNKELGWSFSVSISGSGEDARASITCIKE